MMKVKSFAKVNLMLKVIKKREDGYHELQMLNKRIPLFDEIVITKSENDEIVFIHEEVDPTYLYNVLKQIKNIYNIEKNYQIVITKNIPLGSGLGGASMNATTIINAILEDNNINETLENKINYFKNLGADVPYGFVNDVAIVEGIGENIHVIKSKSLPPLVLVNPGVFISTKDVFENNKVYSKKYSHEDIIESDIYENDLETSAFEICPSLALLKQKLSTYGKVVMSGTGSSLIVHTNEIEKIKKEYPNYLVVKIN